MTLQLRDGTTVEDPRLDRLPSLREDRLDKYPMEAHPGLRQALSKPMRGFTWRHVQLNQGNHPACTAFSETMEAAARPKPYFGDPLHKPPSIAELNRLALAGYSRVKQIDEYPGENYDGSSVDGAAKWGLENGFCTGYYWATGAAEEMVDQAMLAVAYKGPVKCGSHWRRSMYRANSNGFLEYTGSYDGGHAFLFTRASAILDALWTPNSWGGEGAGWISRSTLVRMSKEGAEFCIATGRRVQGQRR